MSVLIFDQDMLRGRIYKKHVLKSHALVDVVSSVSDAFMSLKKDLYSVLLYNAHETQKEISKFLKQIRKSFPKISVVVVYAERQRSLLEMFMSFGVCGAFARANFIPEHLSELVRVI
jgi:DNA-binding NarL/FixJ family response regulator